MTFYAADLARVHHEHYGAVASAAAALLIGGLRAAGHRTGTVVDLACGSGILARELTDQGYDVQGVDISPAMVALAAEHAPDAQFDCGSLFDAPLPAGAVAVAAVGEALSYAVDPRAGLDQLTRLAERAHGALAPGGLLVVDLVTPGRYGPSRQRDLVRDLGAAVVTVQGVEHDDGSLDRRITVFTRIDETTWRRLDERHLQRAYDPAEVAALLRCAGFVSVEVRAGYDDPGPPAPGWAVFVAGR